MATYYVRKTGNDSTGDGSTGLPWLTLQGAFNNSTDDDTIIVDDATPQTYDETLVFTAQRIWIAGSGCYCDGTEGSGAKITRTATGGAGHLMEISGGASNPHQFRGFEFVLANTVVSAEVSRSSSHAIWKDCIIRSTTFTSQQDGLYLTGTKEYHVINCMIYHFGRNCIQPVTASTDVHIQHSSLLGTASGGATIDSAVAADIFIDNSIVAHTTAANTITGSAVFTSVNNDNATTEPSAAWATEATNGVVAGTQGSGSYICFTNITEGSENLQLVSGAGNVAENLAETNNTANATLDPNGDTATSINGVTRDYAAAHDAGAWEIVAAGGATTQLLSQIGTYGMNTLSGGFR